MTEAHNENTRDTWYIIVYTQACEMLHAVSAESKACARALSRVYRRRGGARLADFFLLFGTTRLSTNPTMIRFSRSRLHEGEIPGSYILPTRRPHGEALRLLPREQVSYRFAPVRREHRSAGRRFAEQTSVLKEYPPQQRVLRCVCPDPRPDLRASLRGSFGGRAISRADVEDNPLVEC